MILLIVLVAAIAGGLLAYAWINRRRATPLAASPTPPPPGQPVQPVEQTPASPATGVPPAPDVESTVVTPPPPAEIDDDATRP